MSDQQVRLESVLSQLHDGHISTAEAARQVRTMTFPPKPRLTAYQLQEAAGLPDPEPPEPGSFFAISDAYTQGKINRAQYEALYEAAGGKAHSG
jgi:hypothetical protein